ncbi:uncharacterized protein V3H82_027077 [Fundulus diaphanus]
MPGQTERMALLKAVWFAVSLLVIYYNLGQPGFRQSVSGFFEELLGIKSSSLHVREKRESQTAITNYEFQAVINLSDLEILQLFLNNLSFPISINSTSEISSMDITTVCSTNITEYQCRCEKNFAWSYNNCIKYRVCDGILGDTCGCINGLPADGQFCQLNSSHTAPSTIADYEFQAVINLFELEIFQLFLNNLSFPISISSTSEISSINTATVCSTNITEYQCRCEKTFAWSYNNCITYGVCDVILGDMCGCINNLPADGQFCQLNSSQTVRMALPKLVQFAVVLLVIYYTLDKSGFRQPVSVFFEELNAIKSTSLHEREKRETTTNFTDYEIQVVVSLSDLGVLQMILNNLTYPILINSTTEISQIDTTTVCSSTISGYQCMCEEHYAWSYNNCITYQVCDVIVDHKCGCINDLPADGVFCQLNSSQTVTSTMMTSTSSHSTPYEPEYIDVVLHLHIPFLSGPPDILDVFRTVLENEIFPVTLSQFVEVIELNFTTACSPNSTDGLLCECENGFAWPCEMCNSSSSCSDISSQTCTCIYGLPSNDEFCQPITDIDPCPTTLPEVMKTIPTTVMSPTTTAIPTTATAIQTTATAIPTTTTSTPTVTTTTAAAMPTTVPTTQPTYVKHDVLYDLSIPISSVPPNILDSFRVALKNESFPVTLSSSLKVTELNLTTVCDPNSFYGLQCNCEDGFSWPCEVCNSYKSCSSESSQTCTCLYKPSFVDQYCQPIMGISLCTGVEIVLLFFN